MKKKHLLHVLYSAERIKIAVHTCTWFNRQKDHLLGTKSFVLDDLLHYSFLVACSTSTSEKRHHGPTYSCSHQTGPEKDSYMYNSGAICIKAQELASSSCPFSALQCCMKSWKWAWDEIICQITATTRLRYRLYIYNTNHYANMILVHTDHHHYIQNLWNGKKKLTLIELLLIVHHGTDVVDH